MPAHTRPVGAQAGLARTAVITGASSGIGLAIATDLLDNGWRVKGLSRTRGALPARATWIPCDLADTSSLDSALARIGAQADSAVAAIVHAAGIQRSARLGDLDLEHGRLMWAVHLEAAQAIVNALAPGMPDGGRIVLVGSRTAGGVPGKSQYAATKAALVSLARSWAAELAARRITVNVVAPGPTRTGMLEDPGRAATPVVLPPLGRLVEPYEVAALTRFLLEPTGDMVTGQALVMCGGASLPS